MSENPAPVAQKVKVDRVNQTITFYRTDRPLYETLAKGQEPLLKSLVSAEVSNQDTKEGIQEWPVDFLALDKLYFANTWHAVCLQTKVSASVGLGFMTPEAKERKKKGEQVVMPFEVSKAEKLLTPLCTRTFHETFVDVANDFWNPCNGYLEIVREKPKQNSKITGMHVIKATRAKVEVEDQDANYHYVITMDGGQERKFAAFGDLEEYIDRDEIKGDDQSLVSEVIHFKNLDPSPTSRWYSSPAWIASVPKMELSQCVDQKEFDFFLNRGVPEFMLFILGGTVDPDTWDKIEKAVKANIGTGNAYKSIAANLTGGDFKIEVVKLGAESTGAGDEYGSRMESLASAIVSAHRVPPLLAGIQIPGKLGATNELPQAIAAFQLLVIGPAQKLLQQTLAATLGDPNLNGGLDLTAEDFALVQLTDAMNLQQLDTVARMRQSPEQAKAEGRNLNDGPKD